MKTIARVLLCFLVAIAQQPAFPQVASPLPIAHIQFSDVNGVPLAGGFVYTCAAGSSCPGTPLASYSNAAGAVNTNPIVLDGGGFANLWGAASPYKIVVQDLNGVQQYSIDNLATTQALSGTAGGLASLDSSGHVLQTELTYIGGSGSVNRSIQSKLSDTVSAKDFGAVGNGVADDTLAIQAAINYVLTLTYGGTVYLPMGKYRIGSGGTGLTINKGSAQGFALIGDGPHATNLITSISAMTSGAMVSVVGNGSATTIRGLALQTDIGGNRNIDGLYINNSNGIFLRDLWLSNVGNGAHFHNSSFVYLNEVNAELNSEGINIDTCLGGINIDNSGTYQNQDAGIYITGTTAQTGTSQLPQNQISNMIMQEDTLGGGFGAIQNYSNVETQLSNISMASNNNGAPAVAVYMGSGAARLTISNSSFNHMGNFGIYAASGNLTVTGSTFDHIGAYAAVPTPGGVISPTTMSAAVYMGASTTALVMTGDTLHNLAGFGVVSYAPSNQLANNYIYDFGTGGTLGATRNTTTGLTAISLVPSQSYWQASLVANSITALTSGTTGVSIAPNAVTPAPHSLQAAFNYQSAVSTTWSTTMSAATLATLDTSLDGTTRLASQFISTTAGNNSSNILSTTGIAALYLGDGAATNPHSFSFSWAPSNAIGVISNAQFNVGYQPVAIQPYGANTFFGTLTDNGSGAIVQVNGAASASSYKIGATAGYTGTKTAGSCVMTISGGIITNVTGC